MEGVTRQCLSPYSVQRPATRSALSADMIQSVFGYSSVEMETVVVPWRVPTAELLFEAELEAGVRTSAVLRAQSPERLDAIRKAMATREEFA